MITNAETLDASEALDVNKPISLAEAANYLPRKRSGKKVDVRTIWRWVKFGHRGVKLEGGRMGGTQFTTVGALKRFADACMGRNPQEEVKVTAKKREASKKAASRNLIAAGWKKKPTPASK